MSYKIHQVRRSLLGVPANNEATVIILGAGLAGLGAAQKLREKGITPIVLEARTRPGGRVHTDRSFGFPVELGATWIHKRIGNPITTLAERFNLPIVDVDDSTALFSGPGRRVPHGRSRAFALQAARIRDHLLSKRPSRRRDQSLLSAIMPYRPSEGAMLMLEEISLDYGEDLDVLSWHAWDQDEEFHGPDAWIPGGLDRLIGCLSQRLDIRFGAEVLEVHQDSLGVRIRTSNMRYRAKKVICTLPLGVLKTGRIRFIPDLPVRIHDAIEALHPGTAQTSAALFPHPVLPEETWTQRLSADRACPTEFFAPLGSPAVVATTVGARARAAAAGPPAHALLRGLQGIGDFPAPLSTVSSGWIADRFTLGGWSACPVGVPNSIRRGFKKPCRDVFFAGEHTSEKYPGTMHGAWLTGRRAARKAEKLLRPAKKKERRRS